MADLQYRDSCEWAVGHGVSTAATAEGGSCRKVRTEWVPEHEVERVEAGAAEGVELGIDALGALGSGAEARDRLAALPRLYRAWIAAQQRGLPATPERRAATGRDLLERAERAAQRIEKGIAALDDPAVLDAFRLANRAVATALRRRNPAASAPAPAWRPFQLAFVLLNLAGIADERDPDRRRVDLLFFPTGGGKTEAYLGLAAFTLVLRRLRHPGIASAGVTVLMRYTLRLLTLDQLGRAATLICALELEREKDRARLGDWPFEIGLWVGRGTTPNRMGHKGDKSRESARARTIAYRNDSGRRPSPIPLENCPWCETRFAADSFRLVPNPDRPTDLRISCVNRDCEFVARKRPLPIVAVDEPIYRRLPCFLIATLDKFAALPWDGRVGALFGRVERFDAGGFNGPMDSTGIGTPLAAPLRPPELVIQDELHLIAGPLGTLAGLYETALDELSTRLVEGRRIGPKVVASTATVRRAESQVQALFARGSVEVFPLPGPDRHDSFFAHVRPSGVVPGRLYVGVAAQGRSLKVVLLRAYRALLAGAQQEWNRAGGARNPDNPADAYMTLVGYFNSLRELGGSRRIIEDEVLTALRAYGRRKRDNEAEGRFASRDIAYEPVELTSRVSTAAVADAKRRLALPFRERDRVDVAIATNMISVGLDITRLGLMVVLGQPKTTAEYIQATSRVGRQAERPGLVVTLLNTHRPRDRSHSERAERSVLIVGYAVVRGREVFRELAARWSERPALEVRLCLDVPRGYKETTRSEEVASRFAREFRSDHWPAGRLPRVLHDPRSLELDQRQRSSLHAKCVVVDRQLALVSSANFTGAAQLRNIEVGVLLRDAAFAARLDDRFRALERAGVLQPVTGLEGS